MQQLPTPPSAPKFEQGPPDLAGSAGGIEWGSIADWVAAVGTVFAAFVALGIAWYSHHMAAREPLRQAIVTQPNKSQLFLVNNGVTPIAVRRAFVAVAARPTVHLKDNLGASVLEPGKPLDWSFDLDGAFRAATIAVDRDRPQAPKPEVRAGAVMHADGKLWLWFDGKWITKYDLCEDPECYACRKPGAAS